MAKIKKVPRNTTKSIAALVCPSGFTDERPSSWHDFSRRLEFISFMERKYD